jgi:serine/threonine-protein kinase
VVEDSPQQVTGVREGEILFGKYRVDRLLGVGGMGAVVAAHHLQLDTRVAIKFLLPDTLANEEAVARFAREARAAVLMNNEHVARIFDVGTLATGAPYMVMEFLDGVDLGAFLQQQGPLAVKEAVDFVLQTCEAVAEAHALGIVHRDLKPANLFCIRRPDGRRAIKVLDFGISKVTGSAWSSPDDSLTRAATMMGTPLYMSPEQLEAPQTVDARTDIWALGIILYELLTGKMPFYGNTLPQVSVKIAVRAPQPLRDFRPDAPDGLATVIDTCLEKEREKRYRNVAELALALLPFGPNRARAAVERIIEISEAAGLAGSELLSPLSIEPTSQPAFSESNPPSKENAPAGATGRSFLRLLTAAATLAVAVAITLLSFSRKPLVRDEAAATVLASAPMQPLPNTPSVQETTAIASTLSLSAVAGAPASPDDLSTVAPREPPAPVARTLLPSSKPPPGVRAPAIGLAGVKPNCDPNFDLDDKGRKQFKPECFLSPKR